MTDTITTELREKMGTLGWYDEDGNIVCTTGGEPASEMACLVINSKTFANLCDAIDAVHANLEAENESLRRELDRVLGEQDRDGWVRLPVDADGEYIHFGDVMDQFGTPMTVFAMSNPDPDQGDCMLELITDGISDSTWVRARKMCHYHAPTVEDVLRDLVAAYMDTPLDDSNDDEFFAEYAAKLRLAGES